MIRLLVLVCLLLSSTSASAIDVTGGGGGGSLSGALGTSHTATPACASGYTRVGLWCMDTDANYTQMRSVATNEAGVYTTSTVVSSATRFAIINTTLIVNATTAGEYIGCIIPGDQTVTCTGLPVPGGPYVRITTSTNGGSSYTSIIQTDSSGQLKTSCTILSGAAGYIQCDWYIVGYLD